MDDWEPVFIWWPRKIDGRWIWMAKAERTMVCGGGGLGGSFWWIYRRLA
jgi:hypothetical protein